MTSQDITTGSIDDRLAELSASEGVLDEIFADVVASEATLSGGTKLGDGGQAIRALRECAVLMGNPRDNLVRLTAKLFSSIGVELNDIWKTQMGSGFNFYYLTLTVSLNCPEGVSFESLEFSLDFGPKGPDEPIVQTVFPTSRWRQVMAAGAGMSVSLDGDLHWTVGAALPLHVGQIQGKAGAAMGASGVVVAGNYSFQVGHAEISATGEGNSSCFWRLTNPELKQVQTAEFAVVFKVPSSATSLSLRALCVARPKTAWLVKTLRPVWSALSDRIRQLITHERTPSRTILVGDHEAWGIELPR